jgi:choline/carnitine/betaine transport
VSDTKELVITRSDSGFYEGFNTTVTVSSKILIGLLVIWAAVFPDEAGDFLSEIRDWSFAVFGAWYIYTMALFLIVCVGLALYPKVGKLRLCPHDEPPEFSYFSWVSMMFGAGIGIGMLTYSTAEPIAHFMVNPDTIRGITESGTAGNTDSAFIWSFVHWGLTPWAAYCLTGLAMAYYSYREGHPLTIRSALMPLFGAQRLQGLLGHVVDISAVIATVLGVAVTIGLGVSQFSAGIYEVTGADWLITASGAPSNGGMLSCLVLVMTASVLSALSGVGRGIKWLSNINMFLSIVLLGFFLGWGATLFSVTTLGEVVFEYLVSLPSLLLVYWPEGEGAIEKELFQWQSIGWTVFYWAWWIAYAPFVGLFLARISRGRTIREYVCGVLIVPPLVCFMWMSFIGGTAIDLELSGIAKNAIIGAGQESQLYATLEVLLSGAALRLAIVLVVVLLLTYLVTSVDSAVLIINTINSGGDSSQKGGQHIILWGAGLTLVIAMLLIAGGIDALRASMFVGALPFSFVMVLMAVSLLKSLLFRRRGT